MIRLRLVGKFGKKGMKKNREKKEKGGVVRGGVGGCGVIEGFWWMLKYINWVRIWVRIVRFV